MHLFRPLGRPRKAPGLSAGGPQVARRQVTPLNTSSGGKDKLGRITKKGDRYIRKLLVVGMSSRALLAKKHPERVDIWTANIIAEKPFRLATTAMANKAARIIWAMLTKKREYRQPAV